MMLHDSINDTPLNRMALPKAKVLSKEVLVKPESILMQKRKKQVDTEWRESLIYDCRFEKASAAS